MNSNNTVSRRAFLKSGGTLVVSFALGAVLPKNLQGQRGQAPQPELDSFLAVHEDGTVTIFTSQVDVGTGLSTAFRQTAAEELGISVERFTVVDGDTGTVP